MIKPKNKLFRWGPIDGLPIYPDFWFAGLKNFKKTYSPGWPEAINYFKQEKFTCVIDSDDLYAVGEEIFKRHILPEKKLTTNYQVWLDFLPTYLKLVKKINETTLTKDNISDLLEVWIEINGKEFWNIGSLPEVANWGGERLLERELKQYIKADADFLHAFERLSAPEGISFYQFEELDLLKLIKLQGQKLEQGLIKHQQKYYWLLNSYHGTKVLSVDYFRKRLAKASVGSAAEKIREIKTHKLESVRSKVEIVNKHKLPDKIMNISRALTFTIWWQDIRKSYIFQGNHVIDSLLKALAKIHRIKFHDLHFYNLAELKELAETGVKLSNQEIELRKQCFLAGWDGQKTYYASGHQAEEKFEPYIEKMVTADITEFKGLVVNRGLVRGLVKILHSPKEVGKMKKGDILVASMTSPDYIVALKKAAAVITDVGGMTCHAAIVSRELKIPCIVATKIATKVLKDGGLVEVDADNGIIKKLK